MAVIAAYLDGIRRVLRAPAPWLGGWLVTLLLGVPLALVLRNAIAADLGASLAADSAADAVNWEWWQDFQQQATGIGRAFVPSVLGFASVLRHISDLLDNVDMLPTLAVTVAAWLVLWSFFSGGLLDRYARNRPTWASGFFGACGTHYFRFLRLGVLALPVYYALFAWIHPLLFDTLWNRITRDFTAERSAFAVVVVLYALFGLMLAVVSVVFDYARIRIVVEDRRSAIGALVSGARFVRRNAAAVASLFAINASTFLILSSLYALVAPGAGGTGIAVWLGLAVGQAWILARLWVKLTFYASGISLFQRRLAHADYVATAIPEWPESPAAEAARGEVPAPTAP